jgi:hypothetical protein
MGRIIVVTLLGAALCGCASQTSWRRADGMPSTPDDAKLAEAQCRDRFPNTAFELLTVHEIEGCMAARNYLAIQH